MDDAFTIAAAGPEDAATLAAIGARTFTDTFGHLYRPEDLSAFLEEAHVPETYEAMFRRGYAAWLARDGAGAAVGYCVAGPCALPVDPMPNSAGELSRLYIEGHAQGRGLGVAMLELAVGWLEARYEHLYLSVFSENVGAQRLYARYGFAKVAEYKYMVGNHADHEFLYQRLEDCL